MARVFLTRLRVKLYNLMLLFIEHKYRKKKHRNLISVLGSNENIIKQLLVTIGDELLCFLLLFT